MECPRIPILSPIIGWGHHLIVLYHLQISTAFSPQCILARALQHLAALLKDLNPKLVAVQLQCLVAVHVMVGQVLKPTLHAA